MAKRNIKDVSLDAKYLSGTPISNIMCYRGDFDFYSENWDNIKTPGFYTSWNRGSGGVNHPPAVTGLGTLLVFGNYDYHQLFFPFQGNNRLTGQIVMRSYENNKQVWGDWYTIPFTSDIPNLINQPSNTKDMNINNLEMGGV